TARRSGNVRDAATAAGTASPMAPLRAPTRLAAWWWRMNRCPPDRRIAGAVGQDRLSGQAIVEDPERHAEVDPAPGCLCRFGRRLCLGVGPMGGEPGLCGRALLHPSV